MAFVIPGKSMSEYDSTKEVAASSSAGSKILRKEKMPMDEKELTERLIRTEERAKSNTHRLEKLEPIVNEIHTMSETMVRLVSEVQHTNENVSEIKDKVEILESKPSARMEQIKTAVITAVITAVASGLIGGWIASIFF